MGQIIDRAILQKGSEFKTILIAYYPELDVEKPMGPVVLQNPDQKNSPYKCLIYSNKSLTDEWQYSFEGRAGNRYFIELGKLVVQGYKLVDVRENVSKREYAND